MATSETTTVTAQTTRVRSNRPSLLRWAREVGWRHLLLLSFAAFALFPVAWIVSGSFNAVDNQAAVSIIPDEVTTDNYTELFTDPNTPVDRWLWNSWRVGLVAASLNVVVAALAAYAFSRLRFRGRRVGLITLLLVQVFPQFLGFIALFILAQQMGEVFPQAGLDTHVFLILVYLGGAIGFNAFLIKGFMDTIPDSLDESARVDGASAWVIFSRIVFPLSRPVLAVIFIITFINIFSEYILARTLLRSTQQFTLAVGLQLFVQSDYASKWGNLTAAAVVGALPIVLTFLIAQRQIIGGLTQGAVKG
ncbi:MAG: sugar ABC transporter permease [Acidimicrobiia bacterium]|jgi:arabinogalactan oligomer / maltooligosaccharide transport system permease protein